MKLAQGLVSDCILDDNEHEGEAGNSSRSMCAECKVVGKRDSQTTIYCIKCKSACCKAHSFKICKNCVWAMQHRLCSLSLLMALKSWSNRSNWEMPLTVLSQILWVSPSSAFINDAYWYYPFKTTKMPFLRFYHSVYVSKLLSQFPVGSWAAFV